MEPFDFANPGQEKQVRDWVGEDVVEEVVEGLSLELQKARVDQSDEVVEQKGWQPVLGYDSHLVPVGAQSQEAHDPCMHELPNPGICQLLVCPTCRQLSGRVTTPMRRRIRG